MLRNFQTLIFVLALSFSLTRLNGQNAAGVASISGTVTDPSGASVAGAKVLVENTTNGLRRELTTNESGVFTAPALIPGTGYKVTVTQPGFSEQVSDNIVLAVGSALNIPYKLQVSSSTTQVDVSSDVPIVESAKTDVSQLVDSKQIIDLPINGRRVDSFVLLTPAVVPDGTFGTISFRGVAGHNSFLTDGNDTTNQFYNENAGRTRISSQISQDAVQEFQVISNNSTAEYGRAMGGVVNTVTRSGTNSVHGTGYWFFRNRTLNARDGYSNVNPSEYRHQGGASIGGPIIKDKLFYFFNFERTYRNFPLVASVTASPLFNTAGVFQDVVNGAPQCAAPATQAQCDTARNFVTTRNFGTVPRTVDSNLGFGKIDYRPNDRNSFSFSLNFLRWISPNGIQTQAVLNNGNGIGNNADSTVRTGYGRAVWTYIPSATAVNEARFGWFKDRLFDDASPLFLRPEIGRAGLTVAGVSNLGYATSYPRLNPSEQRFSFADNLSVTLGRHSMKFGVDFASTQDYQVQISNQFGSYNYSTFTNFALDFSGNTTGQKNWNTYSQTFGNPLVDITVKDFSWFAQDQFRVSSKLLLNYGVRWDYASIPQPKLVNPDYPQTGKIPSPTTNYAPRVGAAYTLFGGKTVVRAGYGIFYARYQTGLINTLFINNNLYQRSLSLQSSTAADRLAGPVYPNNLANLDRTPPPGTTSISIADKDLRNPYTHQANFGIDQQIDAKTSLTVSYIWSRGVNLYTVRDLNTGALGNPVTYSILDANRSVTGTYTTDTYRLANRPDTRYQRINQVENGGISYYDGLAVQVNRRLSKGIQGGVAYTWSHAIDFNQGGASNNIFFSGGPTAYYNGQFAQEKGNSINDTRHRAVINTLYEPQWGLKSGNKFIKLALAGWQLSQITTLQSGQPAQATITVNGAAFAGALFNNSLNGLGGPTRVPFAPVNGLKLDPIYRTDARLSKALTFTERYKLFLYFEAFNVSNSQYDTGLRTQQYTVAANSLQILPAAGFNTGSASQGFPDGTNARRAQVGLRFIF